MNITGNETGSVKGIRLRLEEIKKQRDYIKREYYKDEKIVSLKVSTNIRKLGNVKNANLRMLTRAKY
jgi:hypothetical protein